MELIIIISLLVVVSAVLVAALLSNRRKTKELEELSEVKKNYEEVQKYLTDQDSDFPLQWVKTDGKGNRWYQFKNPTRIPAIRSIMGEVAATQAEMKMTMTSLHKFCVAMETKIVEKNFIDLSSLVSRLKERLTWAYEEKTLTSLAVNYFLIEGEDPTTISDEFTEKKRELLSSDIELRAFFLTAAFNYTRTTGNILETDILNSLIQNQQKDKEQKTAFD